MDLSKIVSINGKKGLYKIISHGKNNIIVESLEDRKRFPTFSNDGVSTLENITVYTHDDVTELKKLFQNIFLKQEKEPVCYKDMTDIQLREFFKEILPNYDEEKVFISNIKKVFQWYNILLENDLISIEEENRETDDE